MRCIVWAAVSTKAQAKKQSEETDEEEAKYDKESIPSQIEAARIHLNNREGWHEVHEPLIVPGHTRNYGGISPLTDAAADVPAYAELLQLAREDTFDLLICRSRDRLGRSTGLVATIERYLAEHGIQVLSLEMPTVLLDPENLKKGMDRAGIWSAAVERARAEDEVAQLRTRYSFGMKGRIRKGYHPNSVPFGYRLNSDDIGEIYEPEAAVVRLMYGWLLEGNTLSDILRKLPHHATERYPKSLYLIRYILENPYYCGIVAWGRLEAPWRPKDRQEWIEAKGLHEAIVDRGTWEAVQRELERRKATPRTRYPLTGVTYCGYCGRPMKGAKSGPREHRYRYYVCARDGCQRNSYRADKLESYMADWIRSMDEDPAALEHEIQKALGQADRMQADELEQKQSALEAKRTGLQRWATDYELGLLSREEYYTHQGRLKDEITGLETAIAKACRDTKEPEHAAEVVEKLAEQADWTDRETANLVRTGLGSAGVRITVKDGHADVSLSA